MGTRNQRSPEAGAYRHYYSTARWQRIRLQQLSAYPLCQRCLNKLGRVSPATVCHHVDPSTKLSEFTFFNGPFESLCAPCHDGPVQQVERIGFSTEVGEDGWPVDPRHYANG